MSGAPRGFATWRRAPEVDGRPANRVHLVCDGAGVARCGELSASLSVVVTDIATAARHLCEACSSRLLHDLNDVTGVLADYLREPSSQLHAVVTEALKDLHRVAPLAIGATAKLLIEADGAFHGGDAKRALELIRQWRANMRAIGVLPTG